MPAYHYKHGDRPLEGYTIRHALGRGGFGEVYFAVSDAGREVALKSVQSYEEIELRGIGHCMNLKSPHLVMIFDVKQADDGTPWVIMEYVSGASLRDIMDASPGGLQPEQAVFFVRELAKGIDYLHDSGIVHRDLKPHNVFFEDGIVKIGDYSLSKVITLSQASGHTMTVGSVHYMAPEISMGKYDKTVDLYALGVMLYEMLTGSPPFVGESVGEILMKHLNSDPDVAALSEPFASAVKKAMDREPARRFQSARELADAIRPAVSVPIDDSIPASWSLVGQKTASPADADSARSDESEINVSDPPDLADTVGPSAATSDTAESTPRRAHALLKNPDFDRIGRRIATVHYTTRVALSILATLGLMVFAFTISIDSQTLVLADAAVIPLGVWPTSMLLAMLLVLVVPDHSGWRAGMVSRAWLLFFWALVYGLLRAISEALVRDSFAVACLLGTVVASLVMDWRVFSNEQRRECVMVLPTLVAGALSGIAVAFFFWTQGLVAPVILAMASTMSAAITVQLVSIWNPPSTPSMGSGDGGGADAARESNQRSRRNSNDKPFAAEISTTELALCKLP